MEGNDNILGYSNGKDRNNSENNNNAIEYR